MPYLVMAYYIVMAYIIIAPTFIWPASSSCLVRPGMTVVIENPLSAPYKYHCRMGLDDAL